MPETVRLYTQRKRAKDAVLALSQLNNGGDEKQVDIKVLIPSMGEYYLEVDYPLNLEERVSGILELGEETSAVYDASDCIEFYQGSGLTRFRQA